MIFADEFNQDSKNSKHLQKTFYNHLTFFKIFRNETDKKQCYKKEK